MPRKSKAQKLTEAMMMSNPAMRKVSEQHKKMAKKKGKGGKKC